MRLIKVKYCPPGSIINSIQTYSYRLRINDDNAPENIRLLDVHLKTGNTIRIYSKGTFGYHFAEMISKYVVMAVNEMAKLSNWNTMNMVAMVFDYCQDADFPIACTVSSSQHEVVFRNMTMHRIQE